MFYVLQHTLTLHFDLYIPVDNIRVISCS